MKDIKITQDYFVYKIKEKKIYPICDCDWERIKRMVANVIPHKRVYQTLANICFGILANSIFSLITFGFVENLPSWAMPAAYSIFVVSLVLGIGLSVLDGQQKKVIVVSSFLVLEEMKQIENSCEKEE